MKCVVAILLLAALASANNLEAFRSWAKTNNKLYTRGEEARRFAIYKENLAIIERLNLDSRHATFAPNKFSDLTAAEFTSIYTAGLRSGRKFVPHVVEPAKNADSLDLSYMLPAVKDQASCGSCWAFSAIANMEGQTYKKTGSVVSLSEQQLVSCDKQDLGCNGGSMTTADAYAVSKGITSEELLPYTSGSGIVKACPSRITVVAEFSSYKDLTPLSKLSDAQLISDLDTYGPLSVGIAAGTNYFQSYNSGVMDDVEACGYDLDHGVTLVGYGTEDGLDYWLVRNSWGRSWGEKGYFKLVRGTDMCGINEMVSTIIA